MRVPARRGFLRALGSGTLVAAAAPALAQGLTTIRIGMSLSDATTAMLYGQQSGIFRDAGFDVQVVAGTNGAALAAAVAGGSLEMAQSSLMPIFNGYLRGVPLPIIAGSAMYVSEGPTSVLCVHKDSRFKNPGDLSGGTVGTQALRSLDELGVRTLVDKYRGNSTTLKFVEIAYPLMLNSLKAGNVDAISLAEPHLTVALESGELRKFGSPYAAISEPMLVAAYFGSPTWIAQNRAMIERLTVAMYKAAQYTNTHHAETVAIVAEYAKMDAALVRRMTRSTQATSLDVRLIQPSVDAAAKYKYIERAFNAKELLA